MKIKDKPIEKSQPEKITRLIEEPFPLDVREAIEAMKRTRTSRINRPIFLLPPLKYTRLP
jgi:hypothetical protein